LLARVLFAGSSPISHTRMVHSCLQDSQVTLLILNANLPERTPDKLLTDYLQACILYMQARISVMHVRGAGR
jgi:hypothetical protein